MVEQRHHPILLLLTVIDLFKALQSVDIQSRKSAPLHRAQISATAFYPHDFGIKFCQRVLRRHLAGSIPSTVIGQAKVGPKEVGAIDKQAHFVALECRSFLFVPQIAYMLEGLALGRHRCDL